MAIYLNNNVGVKLATAAAPTVPSIDISAYITNAVINQVADELEVTAMGDTAHKFVAGLQSGTLTLDFINDWASSQVMQTLNAAFGTTLSVSMITVKGTAVSAANPTYQFSILVNNLTPVGQGGVAEIATSSVTFTINSAVTVSPSVAF
ncbi:MAG: radical SAM protein [Microbacteriaceae bacterium]|nr:radical SAM protein [Microbacteriaceae bacterium]NBS61297.1 radical SAM protein [Microbacteriaceae bacterium]